MSEIGKALQVLAWLAFFAWCIYLIAGGAA